MVLAYVILSSLAYLSFADIQTFTKADQEPSPEPVHIQSEYMSITKLDELDTSTNETTPESSANSNTTNNSNASEVETSTEEDSHSSTNETTPESSANSNTTNSSNASEVETSTEEDSQSSTNETTPESSANSNATNSSNASEAETSTEEDSQSSTNTTDGSANSTDPDLLECPSFTCSTEEDQSECLDYDSEDNEYTIHPCGQNKTCDFSTYNLSSSSCADSPPQEPYKERVYGNSSTCNTTSDCKKGNVCLNGICKHKKTEDSYCSLIDQCEDGTICNEGRCIEYFTVTSGDTADYSIACQSGILVNGICQEPELTNGELPKSCKKHKDCLATDGKTEGTCVCVFDSKASSYCKLHRSDSLALEHLKHAHEGNSYNTEYYTRIYNLYPIHLFAEDCYWDNWKELTLVETSEKYAEIESSGMLVAWIGILMIS